MTKTQVDMSKYPAFGEMLERSPPELVARVFGEFLQLTLEIAAAAVANEGPELERKARRELAKQLKPKTTELLSLTARLGNSCAENTVFAVSSELAELIMKEL